MDTMKDTKMQPATDAVIEEQFLELPFDTVMTVTEVIAKLRQFNEWRRCDYGPAEQPEPPNPYEVGLAIDAAVEMLDRLEAAEKERDKLKELNIALYRNSNSQVIHNARLAEENYALRAKIEQMDGTQQCKTR